MNKNNLKIFSIIIIKNFGEKLFIIIKILIINFVCYIKSLLNIEEKKKDENIVVMEVIIS